ncbi:hypothetical protein MOBT1_002028 [Malassezia obtusa]|uniref:Uncharacterized protein n=1 Tax=Malassezia obtusa TaxID=76774 RepID=A0AAF0E0D0_9BASI|nr:hypothetical protein MOBT1_002028 [Malassezia obtusa]
MLAYPARLLFGDDSAKNEFRNSKEFGIPRLYTERHISAADHRYWVQFTTFFESADDVCATLTLAELHQAVEKAPENIVTLVEVLTLHLESLVDDTHFAPVPPYNPGGFSALFASTAPPRPVDSRNRLREVLNCCRVLMRVVPVIYESRPASRADSDIDDLEKRAFWTALPRSRLLRNERRSSVPKEESTNTSDKASDQFIISDGDETVEIAQDPLAAASQDQAAEADGEPVMTGHVLLNTILELLFHAGFTMPWTDEQLESTTSNDISRVHFTIWESGIGCSVDLKGTTGGHIEHRIEVLRLLITMLSKPIYTAPDEKTTTPQDALEYVACSLERPVVLSFLCSLLNTVANYSQGDRWMFLPAGDQQRDILTSLCLQTLCIVLTYEPREPSTEMRNMFLFYVTKLYRVSDFAFLATGAGKMFQLAMSTTRGPFELGAAKGSLFVKTCEEHVSELLVIIWLLLRNNANFRNYIVENRQLSLDLLSWLLYVALTNKDAPPTLVQAQLAIFIVQDLTANRTFCIHLTSLQSAADMTVPSRLLRSHGTVAMDVLIEGVFMLLTRSAGLMAPLYAALLLVLDNTAPFWRNLSLISAARLEQMLLQFASPRFLLANEGNPRLLGILLDAFSRMMLEQFSANANVVYVLVRCAPVIERLESFTLDAALENVYRVREHARGDAAKGEHEGPATQNVAPQAGKPDGAADLSQAPAQDAAPMKNTDKPPIEAKLEASAASNAHEPSTEHTAPQDSANKPAEAEQRVPETNGEARTAHEPETAPAPKDPLSEETKPAQDTQSEHPPSEPKPEHAPHPADQAVERGPEEPTRPVAEPTAAPVQLSKEQLEEVARSVGRNGFVPTTAWVDSWRAALDLRVLKAALADLVPRVNAYCAEPEVMNSSNPHDKVLVFIREQTLTGMLPRPPEFAEVHPFVWTVQSSVWLESYVWGLVYLCGLTLRPVGVFWTPWSR